MASAGNSGARIAIQVALAVVILVLAVLLFRSIVLPFQSFQEREQATAESRSRMDGLRTMLIAYRDQNNTYPSTLDSLLVFARTDSAFAVRNVEFAAPMDSLPFAPRSGRRFEYQVVRSDTSDYSMYWLADPDVPGDSIGTRSPNPSGATFRNAASWE